MSGWTSSGINTAGLLSMINGNAVTSGSQTYFYVASGTESFNGDTVDVALFGNSVTTTTAVADTLAHNAYNGSGGQWVTANECSGTGYTAGGVTLQSKTETFTGAVVTFASTATGGSLPNWTITGTITAYGALVYDATISAAKYAYCWNYFGGEQIVTAGTFTVNWNASGIFAITVSYS
jgi:hypothetical protein